MDTTTRDEVRLTTEAPIYPEWHSPEIIKIELKRTLYEVGSNIDLGQSGSWTN